MTIATSLEDGGQDRSCTRIFGTERTRWRDLLGRIYLSSEVSV